MPSPELWDKYHDQHTEHWGDRYWCRDPALRARPYEPWRVRHYLRQVEAMDAAYNHVARWCANRDPVYEIGCGSGYLARAMHAAGWAGTYTGVDLSPVAIRNATELGLGSDFLFCVDDAAGPLVMEPECMVGVCVLEHLEDPPAVFSHAQGAEVCFVVPSYFSHMRVWGFRGGTAAAEWLEQWVKVDRKIPLITLPNRPGFQLWALEGVVR